MSWKPEPPSQTPDEGLPLHLWDWRQIIKLERDWMRRAQRKPKCSVCGKAMLLGQTESHYTCGSD